MLALNPRLWSSNSSENVVSQNKHETAIQRSEFPIVPNVETVCHAAPVSVKTHHNCRMGYRAVQIADNHLAG